MVNEKKYIRIGELEKISGLPRSTIHFYIREGILHRSIKTARTMAYYDERHVERLKLIKRMKSEYRLPIAFLKSKIEEIEKNKSPSAGPDQSPGAPSSIVSPKKRRQEFIDAAIRIFVAKGYRKTNVRDITEEVGVSAGTFYIYFPTKRDLFMEVVDEIFKGIVGQAAVAIKGEQDLIKRSRIRSRVFNDNYARYSEILNQLRAEMAGEEQWPQEKIKKIYKDITAPPIREAREAVESGVLKSTVDPELLVWAMTGIVEIMSLRLAIDDKYTYDEVMSFTEDMILNGIALKL